MEGIAILNRFVSTSLTEVAISGQMFKRGKGVSHTISKSKQNEKVLQV